MKTMKYLILVFGLAGLLTMFIPSGGTIPITRAIKDPAGLLEFLAIFLVPTVMGLMAIMKPPAQTWMAPVALAGFGFGFVRLKLWEVIPHIPDGAIKNLSGMLIIGGICGGVIVSIVGLAKPEETA